MTVIIYGPPASGKTRNSEALRRHYGCLQVVDDWERRDRLIPGALHLTIPEPQSLLPYVKVVSIEEALREAG